MTAAITPSREDVALDQCWSTLVEMTDRTSPEEYPDMCLITRDELGEFLRLAAKPADEGVRIPATRWKVAELRTHFGIECERPCYHIEVHYGDHAHNIPNFGTKDQARADAECIAAALNARDGALSSTGERKP